MIQEFDNRNKDIKIWINGELLHRDKAKVSVFDSAVQGGDAVWEGIRVYDSRIFCFDAHLDRLMESAKSMDFQDIPTLKYIKDAIFSTLKVYAINDYFQIKSQILILLFYHAIFWFQNSSQLTKLLFY